VVYLYKAGAAWTVPDNDETLNEADKVYPTFTGRIGDDVRFFGFAVPPANLAGYWVVLEEPPAGYRFYGRHDGHDMPVQTAVDAAAWAAGTFAPPVRAMIGKLELA